MILTKTWLNEFIDIENEDFRVIEATLNAVGHEVATVETITIPAKVVVGKVLECEPHPDADKLSVCKVDIGASTEQIVCGAKNVRADIYVAVATLGAKLPGGLEIKPVKLRGIDSKGMICSSNEVGMPKMNDGIMILDDSIGKLVLGKELREYPLLSDSVIEVELTANRGDCQSINGISRDLSAAKGYTRRPQICRVDDDNAKGIGRVLQVDCASEVTSSLMYKVIETEGVKSNFLTDYRCALVGIYDASDIARTLAYATHATGVLLHAYDFEFFYNEDMEKADIKVVNSKGLNKIKCNKKNKASLVGIKHIAEAMAKSDSKMLILEAAYVNPDEISKLAYEQKMETDDQFYRASRGSEPDLELGICHICDVIGKKSQAVFYSEKIQNRPAYHPESIQCRLDEINALVGMEFQKIEINNLLKRLGMEVKATPEQNTLMVVRPRFRHDLVNSADIIEEIVRIIGIDNIPAKPLHIVETDNISSDYDRYKAEYALMQKSVAQGFYQALHFVFDHSKNNEKYGLESVKASLALLNPITAELDVLRTSLIPGLIASAQANIYKSRKSVALFELGNTFDNDRNEYKKVAFIWSGKKESDDVFNHGKPEDIDFKGFVTKLKAIFPGIEFVASTQTAGFVHPGMSADVLMGGQTVGFVSKLHPSIAREMDLPATFIAEIDLGGMALEVKKAHATSKHQRSHRDISVVIARDIPFVDIKKAINGLKIPELKEFYPSDFYYDEKMKENFSLTMRLSLQSDEGEISEERGSAVMDTILNSLKEQFKAELR